MKRRFVILPLMSALFLTFASCGQKYFTSVGETWGTSYHIVYKGSENLADSARAIMAMIDNELSLFNSESTVSRINDCRSDIAGEAFADVLDISCHVCSISGGVYDPTVGPLCELWGFGKSDFREAPSDSAIAAVLESVGIRECRIDSVGRIIKKTSGTRFDFSSVAKGYGIDCIGRMFDRNGVQDYMIEIGGEVLVSGVNPKGLPWHIQIDSPSGGLSHEAFEVRELGPEKMSLATSGNYRNYRTDSTGTVFGHIISPISGIPAVTSVLSVTVEAEQCALADALATACIASGSAESAMEILRKAGINGLVISAGADGEPVEHRCGNF